MVLTVIVIRRILRLAPTVAQSAVGRCNFEAFLHCRRLVPKIERNEKKCSWKLFAQLSIARKSRFSSRTLNFKWSSICREWKKFTELVEHESIATKYSWENYTPIVGYEFCLIFSIEAPALFSTTISKRVLHSSYTPILFEKFFIHAVFVAEKNSNIVFNSPFIRDT